MLRVTSCPVHFLAIPELLLFFTASRFALFSVMAHPSRSHNSQSESENLFPLPVVDQVLEVYGRQPDLSPDAMELSCSGNGPVLSQTGGASELPTLTAWSPCSGEPPSTPNALTASASPTVMPYTASPSPTSCSPVSVAAQTAEFVWTVEWTRLLILTYQEHQYKFQDFNFKKKIIWQAIHTDMLTATSVVPQPTIAQIENKWKTLLAAYKRTRDHNNISGKCRRGCAFQEELDEVLCSKANIRSKVKDIVGKVVTLQDSSEDEGDQVKTIPGKRKASEAESTGPNEKKQKLESTGKQKSESTGKKGKLTETRSRRSDLEPLQKEFAESREQSRREARERHDSKMEKLDRMNNILERLVDKL